MIFMIRFQCETKIRSMIHDDFDIQFGFLLNQLALEPIVCFAESFYTHPVYYYNILGDPRIHGSPGT